MTKTIPYKPQKDVDELIEKALSTRKTECYQKFLKDKILSSAVKQ